MNNSEENNINKKESSESDYENLSKSLSDDIEEFDKKENKTYIRNNIPKKFNQNNNRRLILNESTDKGNTNNKEIKLFIKIIISLIIIRII